MRNQIGEHSIMIAYLTCDKGCEAVLKNRVHFKFKYYNQRITYYKITI